MGAGGYQYLAIGLLAVSVMRAVGAGTVSGAEFSWEWFDPSATSFSGMVQAILIAIFIYWGVGYLPGNQRGN